MKTAQEKIKQQVALYIKLCPIEYAAFLESTRKKKDNIENEWGELKKSDVIQRHVFDLPESLHYMLQDALDQDEFDWFLGRGTYERSHAGLSWFVRSYPQFRITKDF